MGASLSTLAWTASAQAQQFLPTIEIGAARAARTEARGAPAPSTTETPTAEQREAAEKGGAIIGAPPNKASTVYHVDQKGLQLATGAGGANMLRGIGFLPSVDAPAIDAYGLANLPGANKGLRIRGELSQHGNSISTVEGLPLSGINPGPGATFLIDNENLSGLDLYQGPVPSYVTSYFTLPGVIDSRLRWPSEKMGAEISQTVGSASFLRTFGRVDSGEILNGTTRVFASGSWTDAHMWRGVGKAPQGKSGFAVGIATKPFEAFEAKAFIAKSSFDSNTYAGLNYYQASNVGAYRWYNFLPVSSTVPALAVNYAGYNMQHFDSWTALSEFTLRVNETTRLVVKPYYFREDGYYYDGMQNGMVRQWLINHDTYGVTSEIDTRVLDTDIKVGHWYGVQNAPGPPTAWKMFRPNVLGGMTYAAWPILTQQKSPQIFNAAYGVARRDFDALHVEAGARYIWMQIASLEARNSAGIVGDVSYDTALALAPVPIPARSASAHAIGTFLPYGSLAYDVTQNLQLRVSAGGGYAGPSYDVWPAYQQNSATFIRNGITADQLWSAIKPETAAMVDAGFRWSFSDPDFGSGFIQPIAYYSRNHNKAVVYDPGLGVQYGQNVGESESYGVQALGHYAPVEGIDLFSSIGYQHAAFVRDLPTLPLASFAQILATRVSGRQLPNVPYWISTVGANLRVNAFSLTPVLHIVGSRAGDTSGLQPIAGYATIDLNFGYEQALDVGKLDFNLLILNLFDQAYIGQINNGYYQQTASSGIYFPGAPRTVVAKIGMKF